MRFSGSRQWRKVSRRREILHVSLHLNMHAFLKIRGKIYKNNCLWVGELQGLFVYFLRNFCISQVLDKCTFFFIIRKYFFIFKAFYNP